MTPVLAKKTPMLVFYSFMADVQGLGDGENFTIDGARELRHRRGMLRRWCWKAWRRRYALRGRVLLALERR